MSDYSSLAKDSPLHSLPVNRLVRRQPGSRSVCLFLVENFPLCLAATSSIPREPSVIAENNDQAGPSNAGPREATELVRVAWASSKPTRQNYAVVVGDMNSAKLVGGGGRMYPHRIWGTSNSRSMHS